MSETTGQILGADIMLEFSWISRYLQRDQVFAEAMLPGTARRSAAARLCQAGEHKQRQLLLAPSKPRGRPTQPASLRRPKHGMRA